MQSLAHEYEREHGYLTPKSRRPKLSPRSRKAMFAACGKFFSPKNWPEDQLVAEVQEQETELKAQIAMCGTIGGATGTDLVESCYDIFGWDGGTSPDTPALYVFNNPPKPEPEKMVTAPETGKPSPALDTSNWPEAPLHTRIECTDDFDVPPKAIPEPYKVPPKSAKHTYIYLEWRAGQLVEKSRTVVGGEP